MPDRSTRLACRTMAFARVEPYGTVKAADAVALCELLVSNACTLYAPGAVGVQCSMNVTVPPAASVRDVSIVANALPALHCHTSAPVALDRTTKSYCWLLGK